MPELVEMWDVCPETQLRFERFGRVNTMHRFQEVFDHSYSFSRVKLVPTKPTPMLVKRCLQLARKMYPGYNFNGVLVNWYMGGEDFIDWHPDQERDLVPGAPVVSFSFGAERAFQLRKLKSFKQQEGLDWLELVTEDQSMIVMGGDCQKQYEHRIPKVVKKDVVIGKRINVTIRSFKRDEHYDFTETVPVTRVLKETRVQREEQEPPEPPEQPQQQPPKKRTLTDVLMDTAKKPRTRVTTV
jgi:alkylated DNA repair dioxygenase AlkB